MYANMSCVNLVRNVTGCRLDGWGWILDRGKDLSAITSRLARFVLYCCVISGDYLPW
jgi:hypothetical protein